MVGCLKLYHDSITSLTKIKILRAIFHEEIFEIEVVAQDTVILYVWDVKKEMIWQTAANFDSTNILVGYGFGNEKCEAKKAADEALYLWAQS